MSYLGTGKQSGSRSILVRIGVYVLDNASSEFVKSFFGFNNMFNKKNVSSSSGFLLVPSLEQYGLMKLSEFNGAYTV